eukprot:scaffold587_cov339-Pavlova_lutheri.AAC.8
MGRPKLGYRILEAHALGHRGLSLSHWEAFHGKGTHQFANANVPDMFYQTFLCQLMLGINGAHMSPRRLSNAMKDTPTSASWSMHANGTRATTTRCHLVPSST